MSKRSLQTKSNSSFTKKIKHNVDGFKINNIYINSIYGPSYSSFSSPITVYNILSDNKSLYNLDVTFIPFILLFGDIHEYKTSNAECNELPIYSKEIIDLFDSFKCPIDFYLEGNIYSNFTNQTYTRAYPLLMMNNLYLKKCLLNQCPTQNINWFTSNVRYETSTIEGQTSQYLSKFIDYITKDYVNSIKTDIINTPIKIFELLNCFTSRNNSGLFAKFILDSNNNTIISKNIESSLFTYNEWFNFITLYFEYYTSLKNIDNIKYTMYSNFIDSLNKYKMYKNNYIFDFLDNKKNLDKLSNELFTFYTFCGIFLDLYFVTSIFKKTTYRPFIIMGYFGKSHVINIEYLLYNIMKVYTKTAESKTKNDSKCLKLYNIDFDELKTKCFNQI